MIALAEPASLGEVATLEVNPGWAARVARKRTGDPGRKRRISVEGLEQLVLRRITQRTWGRLRQLYVEVNAQRVLVRGSSPTYYLKQLALAAVQETLPATPVELDILVTKAEPRRASGATAG
jgi:hypothetical protein